MMRTKMWTRLVIYHQIMRKHDKCKKVTYPLMFSFVQSDFDKSPISTNPSKPNCTLFAWTQYYDESYHVYSKFVLDIYATGFIFEFVYK